MTRRELVGAAVLLSPFALCALLGLAYELRERVRRARLYAAALRAGFLQQPSERTS
jgi:hypothetical protein